MEIYAQLEKHLRKKNLRWTSQEVGSKRKSQLAFKAIRIVIGIREEIDIYAIRTKGCWVETYSSRREI